MRLRKWVKNIIILGLAGLCVFQTGLLWFDDLRVADFESRLGAWFGWGSAPVTSYEEAVSGLAKPKRMLVSGGGNRYIGKYSGLETTVQYKTAQNILQAVLAGAEYQGMYTGDDIAWYNYLAGSTLVLDYGFAMPSASFAAAMGSTSAEITQRIPSFDMIIFNPEGASQTKVVFANSSSDPNAAAEFIVNHDTPVVYSGMDTSQSLYYNASIPHAIDLGRLVFIPQSAFSGLNYTPIVQSWHFGGIIPNRTDITSKLESFFDYPGAIRTGYMNGEYTLSDTSTHTIVRYLQGYYVEYQNWRSSSDRIIDSLEAAYAEVIAFMKRDTLLENEVYLAGYDYDGSSYRLFFNYVFNDLPVLIGGRLKNWLNMDSFIEATVGKGKVTHYKRYARGIVPGQSVRNPDISYEAAMNGLRAQGFDEGFLSGISSLDLAYIADMNEKNGLYYSVYGDIPLTVQVSE